MIKVCKLNTKRASRIKNSFTWELENIAENGRNKFNQICLISMVLNFQIRNNMQIYCNVLDKSPFNEFGILLCLPGLTGISHKVNNIPGMDNEKHDTQIMTHHEYESQLNV